MKSLILQVLILAPFLVTFASSACLTSKVRKTLSWNFFVFRFRGRPPAPINYRNLTAPGRGWVWRESLALSPPQYDVSLPILLENDQNWKLVNCTSYFPPEDSGREGCTSPDLALLAPPGGGKLGTLDPKGVWAVYQLEEFRITPVGVQVGDVEGEVQGWKEDGGMVDMQFHIGGEQPGYSVKMGEEWDSIVQWEVKLWNPSSSSEVGFVLDDVVIVEDAISPSQDETCTFPTQTPTTPPEPIRTLKFDDLPTGPVPTDPYEGYTLLPPYQISSSPDAVSPPNVLFAPGGNSYSNRILSKSFLFDIISFHITIRSPLPPANLSVTVYFYDPCYDIPSNNGRATSSLYFTPTSLAFTVNSTTEGSGKRRALNVIVGEKASGRMVPFEVDNLVVRSWGEGPEEGGLGLPGCRRCGRYLSAFCAYPLVNWTIARESLDQEGGGYGRG